jgi:hypothetical protein
VIGILHAGASSLAAVNHGRGNISREADNRLARPKITSSILETLMFVCDHEHIFV